MKQNLKILNLSFVILSSLPAYGMASVFSQKSAYSLALPGLAIAGSLVLYTIREYNVWHQYPCRGSGMKP